MSTAPSRSRRRLCCAAEQEENLRAALVLEQAAQCLLHTSPPHVRKYAFHMVLSGLRYNSCGQQQLGMRAYRCVRRSSQTVTIDTSPKLEPSLAWL